MDLTRSISDSFSRAAQTYDQSAEVQSYAAHVCGQKLHDVLPRLPEGPVLEIGCGTGLLTQQLIDCCQGREIVAADVSQDMLDICKSRLASNLHTRNNIKFELLDAQLLPTEPRYALIAASFSFQWFADLTETLERLVQSLLPGGVMLFSFPTCESFGEWKSVCEKSGHEFSGNLLPDVAALRRYAVEKGYDLRCNEIDYILRYDSPLQFFKSLRLSGAATRLKKSSGRVNQLVSVVRAWERESEQSASVTYRIFFGAMSKMPHVSGMSSRREAEIK